MGSKDLAEALRRFLGTDRLRLLELIEKAAVQRNLPLYIVGGAVRDLLLERPINDFDLTVEGDAPALARELAGRYGGAVTVHTKFQTAKWFLPEALQDDFVTLDLISARSETYRHPAALPTVAMGTIADDLRRRDFTINAIALRLDDAHFSEPRDDLNGREDLQRGLVRVLHPRSFIDDPTRLYRAVRYELRYGFRIAEDTLRLIPEARPLVERLSPQRIRHELDLILDEPGAVSMLQRLDELDLLGCIHPSLGKFSYSNLAAVKSAAPLLQKRDSRWLLWLMRLSGQEIESINARLHFNADLLKTLRSAARLEANLPTLSRLKPSQVVNLLEDYSIKALEVFSIAVQDKDQRDVLNRYLSEWRGIKPRTDGHDLKKRGIPPGPKYKEILRRLRAAWLDGEVKTEEEESAILAELLK